MKTISILNLKGGVGKTFTTINMAYELYRRGFRVLLLDNDKQGNLSRAYGRYDMERMAPASRLLDGNWREVEELIFHTDYEGIDIIPSNLSLLGATWRLTAEEGENQLLRYGDFMKRAEVYGSYDYCIIDNPPDVGLNVVNSLTVTDEVIVPVKVDEWALEGLDILADQIEDARQYNPGLKLLGVLITVYQNTDGEAAGREWLEKQAGKEQISGKRIYPVLWTIRYSRKAVESTFCCKPVYEYSPRCSAAQDYKRFVTWYTGIWR